MSHDYSYELRNLIPVPDLEKSHDLNCLLSKTFVAENNNPINF